MARRVFNWNISDKCGHFFCFPRMTPTDLLFSLILNILQSIFNLKIWSEYCSVVVPSSTRKISWPLPTALKITTTRQSLWEITTERKMMGNLHTISVAGLTTLDGCQLKNKLRIILNWAVRTSPSSISVSHSPLEKESFLYWYFKSRYVFSLQVFKPSACQTPQGTMTMWKLWSLAGVLYLAEVKPLKSCRKWKLGRCLTSSAETITEQATLRFVSIFTCNKLIPILPTYIQWASLITIYFYQMYFYGLG